MSGDSAWVYIKSEKQLYTVGFYDPSGTWQPETDFVRASQAAERVHWLNGGHREEQLADVSEITKALQHTSSWLELIFKSGPEGKSILCETNPLYERGLEQNAAVLRKLGIPLLQTAWRDSNAKPK